MKKYSILPLALVLIAAPFFANYREEPLKFGVLQGLLIAFISIGASGGIKPWLERMRRPGFAIFWAVLVILAASAPFFLPFFG
jgi:hypothetical protein